MDREDFNSSNESPISTSMIHNIASDGKSDPFETCVLNRVIHNDEGLRNLPDLVDVVFSCASGAGRGLSLALLALAVARRTVWKL